MRRPAFADVAITAGFAALLLADLARHALWRDETLAWQIAATSDTPLAVFRAMHYDGHPGLWHMLLWPLTRITGDPAAMKLFHGVIGLGVIGLVGLAAPLSRLERVLVLAGYFVVFEYTVISRNYGIGLLLALLYAWQRSAAPERVLTVAALLALMANTNIFAAILSAALALEYLIARIALPGRARLAAGAAIYLAGLGLAVATVWPAADLSRELVQPLGAAYSPGHFVKTLLRFATVGLAPVRAAPLDPEFLLNMPERTEIAALWPYAGAAAAIWGALWWVFRREAGLLLVLGLTLLGASIFGHLVYAVAVRHWGVIFVAFLACLWMLRAKGGKPGLAAACLLGLGTLGGMQSILLQRAVPFSMAPATAEWIRAHGLQDETLITIGDPQASNLAALLGRKVAMVECRCVRPRFVQDRARDGFRRDGLAAAVAATFRAHASGQAVLVSVWELTPGEEAGLHGQAMGVEKLASLTGGWTDEDFHLYRLAGAGP